MDKNKIISFVNSHRGVCRFLSSLYNRLSFKNKLRSKGCKMSLGICVINGLKVISYGRNNEVTIGDFARIRNSTIILHGSHNKITINDLAHLNQVEFYVENDNNEISIGHNTTLWGKTHLAAIEGTKILIGNDCLFSSDLHFRTGDAHSILNMNGERINPSKDIIIDDHVWIGTKVTCMKGVHVSKDSIVAATTTLCKNYDTPNVVIGGVPGKIIKTDVNWSSERL